MCLTELDTTPSCIAFVPSTFATFTSTISPIAPSTQPLSLHRLSIVAVNIPRVVRSNYNQIRCCGALRLAFITIVLHMSSSTCTTSTTSTTSTISTTSTPTPTTVFLRRHDCYITQSEFHWCSGAFARANDLLVSSPNAC
eukprot:m.282754 g.282754  ORF g.282754 m.282754 type:complete len:140 (+) comp19865_c0_seq2:2407-2826(+)